jgi:Protein of unknown function (DUF1194)
MRWIIRWALALTVSVLGQLSSARAAEQVDLLLVLASDVSRSVDHPKFLLQRQGYAKAISDPRVLAAITSGLHQRIAVCFVEWAGYNSQKVVIDWTPIGDEAAARLFGDQLLEAPRSFADRTSISGALYFALKQLDRAPHDADRRTIDVSGDGTNNSGPEVTSARDEVLAKGVTINGLVILTPAAPASLWEHTNPTGGIENYYRDNVIGGPGAFVVVAEDHNSFGQAIVKKLIAEIALLAE